MGWRNIIPPAPDFQKLKEITIPRVEKIPELPEVLMTLEHEQFEERAAILEFDGGLNKQDAENQAKLHMMEMRK